MADILSEEEKRLFLSGLYKNSSKTGEKQTAEQAAKPAAQATSDIPDYARDTLVIPEPPALPPEDDPVLNSEIKIAEEISNMQTNDEPVIESKKSRKHLFLQQEKTAKKETAEKTSEAPSSLLSQLISEGIDGNLDDADAPKKKTSKFLSFTKTKPVAEVTEQPKRRKRSNHKTEPQSLPKKLFNIAAKTTIGAIAASILAGAGSYAWFRGYYYPKHIVQAEGWPYKSKEAIRENILPEDSYAFASDGKTKLGSLFRSTNGNGNTQHRTYLEFKDIPDSFVQALTSTEDQRHFKDDICDFYGIDWCGIGNAALRDIIIVAKKAIGKNGKLAGGSDLNMQLSDNLFGKVLGLPEYKQGSLKSKVYEARDAMRLAAHLSKEDIFELYSNAFYVRQSIYGYAAALQYYFDVDVTTAKDRTAENLVRNAFIAGSVQYPDIVNPFSSNDDEKKKAKTAKAAMKTKHVLHRMFNEGYISNEEYDSAIRFLDEKGVPFNYGEHKLQKDLLVDIVQKENKALFDKGGVCREPIFDGRSDWETINRNGTQIVTSIDSKTQEFAHYTLRRALSMWTVQFDGYNASNGKLPVSKIVKPKSYEFYTAKVKLGNIMIAGENSSIILKFAGGLEGTVDYESLKRMAHFQKQHNQGVLLDANGYFKSKGVRKDVEALLAVIREGIEKGKDVLQLSFKEEKGGKYFFNLEQEPTIEASFMLIDSKTGKMVSMVGSSENKDFNYLSDGSGDFIGSTGKPLLHAAASNRGWPLFGKDSEVRADVAVFGDYAPQNDSESPRVWDSPATMLAASRNISHVSMLTRLHDFVNPADYETLVGKLGLVQKDDESQDEYLKRGVCPQLEMNGNLRMSTITNYVQWTKAAKEKAAFNHALADFLGSPEAAALSNDERDSLKRQMLFEAPAKQIDELKQIKSEFGDETAQWFANYRLEIFGFNFKDLLKEAQALPDTSTLKKGLTGSIVTAGTLKKLQAKMQPYIEEMEQASTKDLYNLKFLRYNPDFKVLAAELDYISYLKKLGMDTSKFQCIPSVALGTIPTHMSELANAYASQYSGQKVIPSIISRYLDKSNNLMCENASQFEKGIITDQVRYHLAQLQHGVAMYGTASALNRMNNAKMSVMIPAGEGSKQKSLRIWAGGKTGTGDDSTFAGFVGIIPNLAGQYDTLPLEKKAHGLTSVNLEDMLIGVVRVQSKTPGKKLQYKNISMYGASTAYEIFTPIAQRLLQQQVDEMKAQGKNLIDPRVIGNGLTILDLVPPSYDADTRYVYLGNKSCDEGECEDDPLEGREVNVSECVPVKRSCSFEYTKSDGSTYSEQCVYSPERCVVTGSSESSETEESEAAEEVEVRNIITLMMPKKK